MDIKKFKLNYPYDKNILIEQLIKNFSLFTTPIKGEGAPGIQTPLILKSKEINYILDYAIQKCIEIFLDNKKPEDYIISPWIYISRNETTSSFYHEHSKLLPGQTKDSVITDFTFTYYVQIPNNLYGNEGHIYFKDKNTEISFLPEEDDFLIFPADLLHRPEKNPNSTKDRIVIAGNLKFNIQKIKTSNTIL